MNLKPNSQNHWLPRYAIAPVAVIAAFFLREELMRLTGGSLPTYVSFYPAVMLVALLAGLGPGLLATLTAAIVTDYWILPPTGQIAVASLADAVGLALFSGMGLLMSVVAGLYRGARQKAAAYERGAAIPQALAAPPPRLRDRIFINAGLLLSLVILAAVGWQIQRNLRAVAEADQWETHTRDVIEGLDRLLSALENAETGQRGFVITADEKCLEPYETALAQVETNLSELKGLTQDNALQQQRLTSMEPTIRQKLAELKDTIQMRRTNGFRPAQAMVATHLGRNLMDDLRKHVAQAQAEEKRLLEQRNAAKDLSAGKTLQSLLAGGILGFSMLAAVLLFLRQENARRLQVEAELRRHQDRLQEMVDARTAELARANESLRQQREWLNVTLTSIGDAVLTADNAGQITFLNPVAEALTGWLEEEALGQPAQRIFRIINEKTRASADDIIARVLQEGHAVALANHTALLARDGREIPIEDSAAPIKDSAGALSGVVLVFHDVTQRRRAQEALRESEKRLSFALEINHTGAWDLDLRDHTAQRSLEHDRIFGYTELLPEWSYDMFLEHVLPEDRPMVDGAFSRAMETGGDWSFECRIRRADQQIRWIWAAGRHRTDAAGVRWGIAGIVQDITERKEAEGEIRRQAEELRARNADLTRFNNVTVGRELRIIDLKKQVNDLCTKLGQPPRYRQELEDETKPPSV